MAYTDKLQKTLNGLKSVYGQGSIMSLEDEAQKIEVVGSTGSLSLDECVGVGGYPLGRIIEIYGPESSGKTTLCLHAIAEAQKNGYVCAMIDVENAYDPIYGEKIGVDHSRLIFSQPDYGEQALDIVEKLIDSGELGLIIVDSVAALIPKAELDGEVGDLKVGLQARLMSQAMRKFAAKTNKTGTTLIFTNQLREKIGTMWGNPEVTTGGNALKFYASIRLDIRRIQINKSTEGGGTEAISNKTRVKVVKNKVAPPFKEAIFDIVYGVGISRASEVIEVALSRGILLKTGAGIFHSFETPLHPKDIAINTTEAKAAESLSNDPLLFPLKREIELIVEGKSAEEIEEELRDSYAEAYKKNNLYLNYWDLGSKASSSSKHVEALYYLTQAIECNPFSKEAKDKLRAVEERIEKRKKKGELQSETDWIISREDGSTFNVLTSEVIE